MVDERFRPVILETEDMNRRMVKVLAVELGIEQRQLIHDALVAYVRAQRQSHPDLIMNCASPHKKDRSHARTT